MGLALLHFCSGNMQGSRDLHKPRQVKLLVVLSFWWYVDKKQRQNKTRSGTAG
ncbi:hypothetical protein HRM2_16210 [Desulforapulum autotrophicum HRM2]|uniref:Uncharacterized protein n=1 Tax=Desulforapulum autotrophicum (strain ATCC 43914 / DSM 3382 / VKM B-1955 / HRM2) TaxID=177437 RepID=C0QAE5_DESAH|nr:hypothetical protein HRM2_16210 [Desulforapulum autotrophicum HRM2]